MFRLGKFEIGEKVYVIDRYTNEETCPLCEGTGQYNNHKCPEPLCRGTGKIHLCNGEWFVKENPGEVVMIYTIQNGYVGKTYNKYNIQWEKWSDKQNIQTGFHDTIYEEYLFRTKDEAQKACNFNNLFVSDNLNEENEKTYDNIMYQINEGLEYINNEENRNQKGEKYAM